MFQNDEEFYSSLPVLENFEDISDISKYQRMPDSWYVALTDIKGSTKAIESGRYKDVNTVGASSIVAILNLKKSFSLPFIFGGDGATICVPPSLLKQTRQALVGIKLMAKEQFNMELRVGLIPVKEIHSSPNSLLVSKFHISKSSVQAAFAGGGIQYAEHCLKHSDEFNMELSDEKPIADFSGLECRWENVPSKRGEIVSIIVCAVNSSYEQSGFIYKDIIRKIEDIYGEDSICHPVAEEELRLTLSNRILNYEYKVRTFNKDFSTKIKYKLEQFYRVLAGKYLISKEKTVNGYNWGNYKHDLITNTDFKKFDDQLRFVISGTPEQRMELEKYLKKKLDSRQLVYGIHHAPTALITCLIYNYHNQHIHFVDGDNGGYALAAKQLKKQLKELKLD